MPPESALPRIYTSGWTPSCWQAKSAPVRRGRSGFRRRRRGRARGRRSRPHRADSLPGDQNARLALDRLEEKGAGIRRDRLLERFRVAERDGNEAGSERAEAVAVERFGGEAGDGGGAAVKVVLADDDFGAARRNVLVRVAQRRTALMPFRPPRRRCSWAAPSPCRTARPAPRGTSAIGRCGRRARSG